VVPSASHELGYGLTGYRQDMSCIRFNTPAQRKQMAATAPVMLTAEEAAVLHPAPPVTDSKILRLRLLAVSANPKIRESVASSHHTPADLLGRLARDENAGVRGCVARNEVAPHEALRKLSYDADETVRGWVAVNFFAPEDVIRALGDDSSATVRALVVWKSSRTEPVAV
jgi:hypothetical protein